MVLDRQRVRGGQLWGFENQIFKLNDIRVLADIELKIISKIMYYAADCIATRLSQPNFTETSLVFLDSYLK